MHQPAYFAAISTSHGAPTAFCTKSLYNCKTSTISSTILNSKFARKCVIVPWLLGSSSALQSTLYFSLTYLFSSLHPRHKFCQFLRFWEWITRAKKSNIAMACPFCLTVFLVSCFFVYKILFALFFFYVADCVVFGWLINSLYISCLFFVL